MTRALAREKREPRELYQTRRPLADVLAYVALDRWLWQKGPIYPNELTIDVLEPGCHAGPFLRAVDTHWTVTRGQPAECISLTGLDLYLPPAMPADWALVEADFTALTSADQKYLASDMILGNPPFSLASEFIRAGLELLNPGGLLGYLLSVNTFGSLERFELFQKHPPVEILFLTPRPGFIREGKKNGSDHGQYVFAMWYGTLSHTGSLFRWLNWKSK